MNRLYCILIGLFFVVGWSLQAQTNTDTISEEEKIYDWDSVDVRPQFPGGEDALMKFLRDSLKYPCFEANVEGKVYIAFVVETDGSLTDFMVRRSPHPLLSDEVMRVSKLMPNWEPAVLNGEKVRVRFILPVDFVLR